MPFNSIWQGEQVMENKQQKTILIIETHRALRSLYELELREAGFNTLQAASNTEAQQLLSDHGVDLLMTGLPKYQTVSLGTLISLAKARNIPLLINTGYPVSMIDHRTVREVASIQQKSSDIDKLKDKINELLSSERRTIQPRPGQQSDAAPD
jgi:DNA-binding NtrC family response regulator